MENFFDLRILMVALLRKLKLIFVITLVMAVGWASIRFIPAIINYLSYDSQIENAADESTLTEQEQPYYYQARRTIYVDPQYIELNGLVTDVSYRITEGYNSFSQNKEILNPLTQEFFSEVKSADAEQKQKMVKCNYRTKLVLSEEFRTTNFYALFTMDRYGNNIVNLRATTGNAELSEQMVVEFERLLSAYVAEQIGPFSYKVTEGAMGMYLPTVTDGLIPKSNASLTATTVVGTKPELSAILKQTVKGGIMGVLGGVALSIALVFFFAVVSPTVGNEADLKLFSRRVFSVYYNRTKKRRFVFIDKWINALEGDITQEISLDSLCAVLIEKIMYEGIHDADVLMTGCGNAEETQKFVESLEACRPADCTLHFVFSPCVIYDAAATKACRDVAAVVLLEQAGKSSKHEIQRELDEFSALNKNVLGFVLLK